MSADLPTLLLAGIFLVALLYSSVGHAGASGYIAVMTLCSMAPAEIKTTALVLNIVVASITTWQFWRAGHFSWPLFWPFALPSIPFAFLGGYLQLPDHFFKILIGGILLYVSARFLLKPPQEIYHPHLPGKPAAFAAGSIIGLLSGLSGTGGGIFLTPVILMGRWARTSVAAGVSAPFILVNSVAGLLGNMSAMERVPAAVLPMVFVVAIGGSMGSYIGSERLPHVAIKQLLALVLAVAGLKFIFT